MISHPQISWLENDVPLSNQFDDTYFTKSDGRAETDFVYIKGNNLPLRWRTTPTMTIGELGFGTGLNFLETARQWQQICAPSDQLRFISYEKYPLKIEDITKALSRWNALIPLIDRLEEIWHWENDLLNVMFTPQIKLVVNFGDANKQITRQKTMVDAWYLDGFSPAKNPELWNEYLMQQVFDQTNPGGTIATYTVAGYVRRNLLQAGFEISRQIGFGTKRQMLTGTKPIFGA